MGDLHSILRKSDGKLFFVASGEGRRTMMNDEKLDEELRNRFVAAIENDPDILEEDLDTFFTDGTMEELRDILQCADNDIDKIYFEDYVQTLKERINYGEEEEEE